MHSETGSEGLILRLRFEELPSESEIMLVRRELITGCGEMMKLEWNEIQNDDIRQERTLEPEEPAILS